MFISKEGGATEKGLLSLLHLKLPPCRANLLGVDHFFYFQSINEHFLFIIILDVTIIPVSQVTMFIWSYNILFELGHLHLTFGDLFKPC